MTQPGRTWTVKDALEWTRGYLDRKGDAHALLSARTLLSHATDLSHLELYTLFDRPLSQSERDVLREGVARRGAGEPLQYITGTAPFRYLEVKVRPGVLIPRPETEVLVDEALAAIGDAEAPQVADICCGSGCIACAVATEAPSSEVWATDISPEACALTRENARSCGAEARVRVVECDLDAGIPADLAGTFDCVASNPPYIPDEVMAALPAEVKDHEPELALAGGADGLDVFRRLLLSAQRLLKPGGALVVELHEGSLEDACALTRDAGMEEVRAVHDLAGKPRVLVARKGERA